MRLSAILLLAASAASVSALPAPVDSLSTGFRTLTSRAASETEDVRETIKALGGYYRALRNSLEGFVGDVKLQRNKKASCGDLSNVQIPLDDILEGPGDSVLTNVVVGHGYQNYTCESDDSEAKLIGAVAHLFDASCLAASQPELLHSIPGVIEKVPFVELEDPEGEASYLNPVFVPITLFGAFSQKSVVDAQSVTLTPKKIATVGRHFFTEDGVPFFRFGDKVSDDDSRIGAKKHSDGDSPTGSIKWLKLEETEMPDENSYKLVYRINTAGGLAPNCKKADLGKVISVQYAAEYWFYS